MRHALAVGVPEPASCEERLNRAPKPLAWRDLYPYASVAIGDVSPIAPRASLDDGRLAPTKNAGLRVAFHRQLTFQHGEPLDQSWVVVFPPPTAAQRAPSSRRSSA
jgi:hypothetical protein